MVALDVQQWFARAFSSEVWLGNKKIIYYDKIIDFWFNSIHRHLL